MSKRGADDSAGNSSDTATQQPIIKKVNFGPHVIGTITTMEELDCKILRYQNKKLAQRIEQRIRNEAELKSRIEQLEKRQMQDDTVLNVVNRYWNQFNEDIRVMLQRFDAETADESENKNESEVTTSFLIQLSTWDKEELDEKLAKRVQVSKMAVAKIIQVFDRLMQRNQKITRMLKEESIEEDGNDKNSIPNIEETLRKSTIELMEENKNLQSQNVQLHEKFHNFSLKMSKHQDALAGKETEAAELRNQIDELQYEMEKARCRNDKLENYLAEAIENLKNIEMCEDKQAQTPGTSTQAKALSGQMTRIDTQKMDYMQKDLEEFRELATNRLQELDKLHQEHREVLKEVEKLKMDIRHLPEAVIVETTEYKCLQSQYSVLYNENMQIKNLLEETRNQLQASKEQHIQQIEYMEKNELIDQKRIRDEMIKLEDMLEKVQKEYSILRVEYEQNMVTNEQTAPINREMRNLITSLQNHNNQLKGEVTRHKRKYKEMCAENTKLRKELDDIVADMKSQEMKMVKQKMEMKTEENPNVKEKETQEVNLTAVKDESGSVTMKTDPEHTETDSGKQITVKIEKKEGNEKEEAVGTPFSSVKLEKDVKDEQKLPENDEQLRELQKQLKKSLIDQREMKLLLDMYKGVSKEVKDKAQLMATERLLRAELEDMKNQMKKMQESKREDRKKLADEDAKKKIKQLTEQLELQKQLAVPKPADGQPWGYRPFVGSNEEEALLNEMEVTGLAYEEMQEQNSRLLQQLKEKDDANFKLMSDRIKTNQLNKLFREEKQVLEEQVTIQRTEIDSLHTLLRKLEEMERISQSKITAKEKELEFCRQALELHKRKAIEQAQSAADLKRHLDKYHLQNNEAQQVVAEKTSALEAEAYKNKRLQEEYIQFKRKAERMKNMEMNCATYDEVLLEEIREYKEVLTCPSCKIKKKNAVLSKCFHVFCYDCLRTRYETRQRKCPKCNCAFGANDYHRLYLT